MIAEHVIPATVDSRRRAVLPEGIAAGDAITYQQLDDDTWIVRRQKPSREFAVVILRDVVKLPDDPEWEKTEKAFSADASDGLTPPKE